MRGNILTQKVDLMSLNYQIDKHEMFTGGAPEYIIMSNKTLNLMKISCACEYDYIPDGKLGQIVEYHGIRIAIDDGLDLGEVVTK